MGVVVRAVEVNAATRAVVVGAFAVVGAFLVFVECAALDFFALAAAAAAAFALALRCASDSWLRAWS